jgi:hypothetical protein
MSLEKCSDGFVYERNVIEILGKLSDRYELGSRNVMNPALLIDQISL